MNNEEKILEMLAQIQEDQKQMREEQQHMREEQKQMREDQQHMREEQKQMREDQQHMRDDIAGIKLRLELDIEKRFDAVNEGIDAILAQLTPKRRIEEMDEDITILKTAVKMLTQEVGELKKAQ